MIADAFLDAEIARREVELAILKQQRTDRRAADFLLLLARVIPAGVTFSAAELLAHARLDRDLAAATAHLTPRALGHRLAHVAARPAACGPILQCVTRANRCGRIWQIVLAP